MNIDQSFHELVRLVRRFQAIERPNSAAPDSRDSSRRNKKCLILWKLSLCAYIQSGWCGQGYSNWPFWVNKPHHHVTVTKNRFQRRNPPNQWPINVSNVIIPHLDTPKMKTWVKIVHNQWERWVCFIRGKDKKSNHTSSRLALLIWDLPLKTNYFYEQITIFKS